MMTSTLKTSTVHNMFICELLLCIHNMFICELLLCIHNMFICELLLFCLRFGYEDTETQTTQINIYF